MTMQEYLELDEAKRMSARMSALQAVGGVQQMVSSEDVEVISEVGQRRTMLVRRQNSKSLKYVYTESITLENGIRIAKFGFGIVKRHRHGSSGEKHLNLRRTRQCEAG